MDLWGECDKRPMETLDTEKYFVVWPTPNPVQQSPQDYKSLLD